MAELLRFELIGPVAGAVVLDSDRWGISTFGRSRSHRVSNVPTVDGFLTRALGENPTALNIAGVYYPAGRLGAGRRFIRAGANWYRPELERLGCPLEGELLSVRGGPVSFGVFILEVIEYDHTSLLQLPVEPFGFAPARIGWRMRLVASRESVSVDGNAAATQAVRRPPAGRWADGRDTALSGRGHPHGHHVRRRR